MEQKQRTIFYSWQSDDAVTKNYLYKCLNRVVKNIKNDSIIDGDIVLDESTKNKMGAVDIPATIMEKIDKCDVFVADLRWCLSRFYCCCPCAQLVLGCPYAVP